jgi:hypothetical protein
MLKGIDWKNSCRLLLALYNKSLDASGGGVFRIMTGPAMLD